MLYNDEYIDKIKCHVNELDSRIPFYVFNLDEFGERVRKIQKRLKSSELIYAVKANPFLIGAADKVCRHFEVCSSGELEECLSAKVNSEKVVYTGVLKTKEDIDFALSSHVGVISIESEQQLHLIDEWAQEKDINYKINTLLRRTCGDQFGLNDSQIETILREQVNQKKWQRLQFCGLQFFSGTQKKIEKTLEEIDDLALFADTLEKNIGWKAEYLEIGAGLQIEYFYPKVLEQEENPYSELDILSEKLTRQKYQFKVELGRYASASCGCYVATVLDTKCNIDTNYALLNGGIGHVTYYKSNNGLRRPRILHLSNMDDFNSVRSDETSDDAKAWNLCGPICSSMDIVARNVPFESLDVNDILIFPNLGGYSATWSSFLFLSRPLPEICFYDNGELRAVRHSIRSSEINRPEENI